MYLHWDEKTVTDFSPEAIASMYNHGYVFTRIGKGVMHQTRSVRVPVSSYSATSENRRILKKTGSITLQAASLPFADYTFMIGKLAKDFYDIKFGPNIMSAQKVKEMMTDPNKSNFNTLFLYSEPSGPLGYSICYSSALLLHYSYPFYDLEKSPKDMGMGMMARAVQYAKDAGMKYVYLGSLQRPGDAYKLQFAGMEWFNGSEWKTDLEEAKNMLRP